jgi:hypothetical protein
MTRRLARTGRTLQATAPIAADSRIVRDAESAGQPSAGSGPAASF